MKTNVRVVVPRRNVLRMLELGKEIVTKHKEMGERSPLNGLVDVNQLEAMLSEAYKQNNLSEEHHRKGEKATEKRNSILGTGRNQVTSSPDTVLYFIVVIREILLGLHKGNERALGDWGYTVNSAINTNKKGIE